MGVLDALRAARILPLSYPMSGIVAYHDLNNQYWAAPPLRETGWHILGTVRMGDDPVASVVDGFGRSHEGPNLFVIDGSVMPTSGAVNPTATVAALALRNAEAIVANRRDQRFSF